MTLLLVVLLSDSALVCSSVEMTWTVLSIVLSWWWWNHHRLNTQFLLLAVELLGVKFYVLEQFLTATSSFKVSNSNQLIKSPSHKYVLKHFLAFDLIRLPPGKKIADPVGEAARQSVRPVFRPVEGVPPDFSPPQDQPEDTCRPPLAPDGQLRTVPPQHCHHVLRTLGYNKQPALWLGRGMGIFDIYDQIWWRLTTAITLNYMINYV